VTITFPHGPTRCEIDKHNKVGRRRARVHPTALQIKHISKYFRTRSPVSAADIDGWRAGELIALCFGGMMKSFRGSSEFI
jgi:hypothetical protein